MNRTSPKINIIFLSLALVVIIILIALYTLIYFANRENDKLVDNMRIKQ